MLNYKDRLKMGIAHYNSLSEDERDGDTAMHLKMMIDVAKHYGKLACLDVALPAAQAREFIEKFNSVTGKKIRTMCDKSKRQMAKLIKEKYTVDDVMAVAALVREEDWCRERPHLLNAEYVTRSTSFHKYHGAKQVGDYVQSEKPKEVNW